MNTNYVVEFNYYVVMKLNLYYATSPSFIGSNVTELTIIYYVF